MVNELLSPGVAVGTIAIAAGAVGFICHRAKSLINSDRFALMGIMGAFVFAAQMVQFSLPFLPGASGHMVGAVLLAIMLGPIPASIVLSSVIIVQCLIFQDGGLLALGCNIINMAIVPCFLGCYVYNIGAGLSLLAVDKPDGLEWSYAQRPDQPTFEAIISNDSVVIAAVDKVQSKLSPLPDYTIRTEASGTTTGESSTHAGMGWTSFAAVAGSAITMLLVWLAGWAIRKRNGLHNAPYPN